MLVADREFSERRACRPHGPPPRLHQYGRRLGAPQDFGFIDRNGNRNPPGSFVSAGEFSEGLAAVTANDDEGWAWIDSRGKTKIPVLACSSAGEFRGGLAAVSVEDPATGETRWGYINKKGKYVWEPRA